jgi:hypothetical protein
MMMRDTLCSPRRDGGVGSQIALKFCAERCWWQELTEGILRKAKSKRFLLATFATLREMMGWILNLKANGSPRMLLLRQRRKERQVTAFGPEQFAHCSIRKPKDEILGGKLKLPHHSKKMGTGQKKPREREAQGGRGK